MGQFILNEGVAPSTPAAGYVSLYAKTDGNIYSKDDAGTEKSVATVTTATTKLPDIVVTPSAGALTISSELVYIDIRSATLTDGTSSTLLTTADTLVIPSGATLGAITTIEAECIIVEMNNAGVAEKAVINLSGGVDLSERGLISTTAISTGADSANVFYSTTARTNVPYKIIGSFKATNNSGAWGSPTLVQGAGGNNILKSYSMIRLNTANGYGSTNIVIRRFLTTVENTGVDITYADSATLGASFTINTNGIYAINYSDNFNVASDCGISLNSTQLTTSILTINIANSLSEDTTSGGNTRANPSWSGRLNAGDVIRAHTAGTTTGTSHITFTIARIG